MILYVHLEKTQFQVQNTVVFTRHDFQIYLHFHLYSLTIVSTYQYFWVKMHYCTKKNSTENSSVKVKDTNPRDYIVILKSNKNCICSPTTNLSPLLHGQILSLKASKAESPISHPLPCIETSLKAQLPENWSSLMQSGFRKKNVGTLVQTSLPVADIRLKLKENQNLQRNQRTENTCDFHYRTILVLPLGN